MKDHKCTIQGAKKNHSANKKRLQIVETGWHKSGKTEINRNGYVDFSYKNIRQQIRFRVYEGITSEIQLQRKEKQDTYIMYITNLYQSLYTLWNNNRIRL